MTEKALTLRPTQSIILSPDEVVANATAQAKLLMNIVEQTKCFQVISGKKYLQVEAWETIGAFNRVHAATESITPIFRDGVTVGYDAKVNLVNADGVTVGTAIMPCYFTENACKGKEGDAKDKACKSAAQTFATSKAYRMNYSYVAILAGYEPLPADELTDDMAKDDKPEPNIKEHYCTEHKVNFFKKGKMNAYAHPIGDTGTWCHEEKAKPSPKTKEQIKQDISDLYGQQQHSAAQTAPLGEKPTQEPQGTAVKAEVVVTASSEPVKDSSEKKPTIKTYPMPSSYEITKFWDEMGNNGLNVKGVEELLGCTILAWMQSQGHSLDEAREKVKKGLEPK